MKAFYGVLPLLIFSVIINTLMISQSYALSCGGDCRTVQEGGGCAIYAEGTCTVDNAGTCLLISNLTKRSHFIPARAGNNDWPNFLSKANRDRFKFADCPVPVQPTPPPVTPTPPTTPPPTPPVTPPPPTEPDPCNGNGQCECITNRGGVVDSENCGVNISKAACQAMVGQNNVTRVAYSCSSPPANACTDPTKKAHCECYFLYEQPSAFESVGIGTITKSACQDMVGKGGSKKYYKCEWDGECGTSTFGCEPWLPGCRNSTPSPSATCWWDAQFTAPVMAPASVGPEYECNGPQVCTPSIVGVKKFCGPGMGDTQAQKGNITCRCN